MTLVVISSAHSLRVGGRRPTPAIPVTLTSTDYFKESNTNITIPVRVGPKQRFRNRACISVRSYWCDRTLWCTVRVSKMIALNNVVTFGIVQHFLTKFSEIISGTVCHCRWNFCHFIFRCLQVAQLLNIKDDFFPTMRLQTNTSEYNLLSGVFWAYNTFKMQRKTRIISLAQNLSSPGRFTVHVQSV